MNLLINVPAILAYETDITSIVFCNKPNFQNSER